MTKLKSKAIACCVFGLLSSNIVHAAEPNCTVSNSVHNATAENCSELSFIHRHIRDEKSLKAQQNPLSLEVKDTEVINSQINAERTANQIAETRILLSIDSLQQI